MERGYDRVAERYSSGVPHGADRPRHRFVAELVAELPRDAAVLDLGAGSAAVWSTRAAAGFELTLVDVSQAQLALARAARPAALTLHADMTEVAFAAGSFDAVVALYSLIHLYGPRGRDRGLFAPLGALMRSSRSTP